MLKTINGAVVITMIISVMNSTKSTKIFIQLEKTII
jgi:hypothetical protein